MMGVDVYEMPQLHREVYHGRLRQVKHLIDTGAGVNSKSKEGLTPLHAALCHGHIESMNYLIKSGADVNSKQNTEATPLHFASYFGHYKWVKLLVNAGADVNSIDTDGNTPLMIATMDSVNQFRQSCEICIEMLLHKRAKINISNKYNRNALQAHIAYHYSKNRDFNPRICQVLIAAGELPSLSGEDFVLLRNVLKHDEFIEFVRKELASPGLKIHLKGTIRLILLELDQHKNLFCRTQRLSLPKSLSRHLVLNVRLLDRADYVLDDRYNNDP